MTSVRLPDAIIELASRLIACRDESSLQASLSDSVKTLLSSDYCSLRLVTDDDGDSVTLRRSGPDNGQLIDRLLSGWVTKYQQVLNSPNLSEDERLPFLHGKDMAFTSAIAAPIQYNGSITGVLVVGRTSPFKYVDSDVEDVTSVCQLVAPTITRLQEEHRLRKENAKLRGLVARHEAVAKLVGRAESWERVLSALNTVGPAETRVLLTGESGTGKEMCAKALHEMSSRREGNFVAVNCSAIPEHLAESELFGHVRGSFTGATRDYDGLFVQAEGGTLFLDEIGTTSLSVQASLLRAIQEGEIRPVGSPKSRPVDVRIISSTSANLAAMIERGTFRKDLFYRLNVVTIPLPALRDRRSDIAILASEFLLIQSQRRSRPIHSISPEALVALEAYSWPGNVRELTNAIEHAVLFNKPDDPVLQLECLPESVRLASGAIGDATPRISEAGLDHYLEFLENRILRNALEQAHGNQSAAARALGVSEKRIRDRMAKFGIRREDHEGTVLGE